MNIFGFEVGYDVNFDGKILLKIHFYVGAKLWLLNDGIEWKIQVLFSKATG